MITKSNRLKRTFSWRIGHRRGTQINLQSSPSKVAAFQMHWRSPVYADSQANPCVNHSNIFQRLIARFIPACGGEKLLPDCDQVHGRFPIISSLVSPLFPTSTPARDERLGRNDLQPERVGLNRGTFNKTDRLKSALQARIDAILLFSTPGVGRTPTRPEIIELNVPFISRHILHH